MDDQNFTTADLMTVADVPNSRVSEISRTLGIRGRASRGGSAPSQYTVEQAVLIVTVRHLQQLGMSVVDAAKAVRRVTHQDLKRIIISDAPEWLVVFADGHAEVCDGSRMLDLAEGRGGVLTGLRIVNIHSVLKDVFTARLERLNAMEQARDSESIVGTCSASPGTTGITLHGDLRVSIYHRGRGLQVRLTPEMARNFARQLEATADALEAKPAAEVVN
jgi:hypothetical protein